MSSKEGDAVLSSLYFDELTTVDFLGIDFSLLEGLFLIS